MRSIEHGTLVEDLRGLCSGDNLVAPVNCVGDQIGEDVGAGSSMPGPSAGARDVSGAVASIREV